MRDTERHRRKLRQAVVWLRKKGYTEFAREVRVEVGGRVFYVDLVAVRGKEVTAVEVGKCSEEKIRALAKEFSSVIHYPYHGKVRVLSGQGSGWRWLRRHIRKTGSTVVLGKI